MSRKQKKSLLRIIVGADTAVALLLGASRSLGYGSNGGVSYSTLPGSGGDVLWRAVRNASRGHVFDEHYDLRQPRHCRRILHAGVDLQAVLWLCCSTRIGELFRSCNAVGKSQKGHFQPEWISARITPILLKGGPKIWRKSMPEAGGNRARKFLLRAGEQIPLDGHCAGKAKRLWIPRRWQGNLPRARL